MATQSNIKLPWVHFSNLPRQMLYGSKIYVQKYKSRLCFNNNKSGIQARVNSETSIILQYIVAIIFIHILNECIIYF